MRSSGRAYSVGKCEANIHKDKRTELENVLLEYFKVEAVYDDVIKPESKCSWLLEIEGYISHSCTVFSRGVYENKYFCGGILYWM